MGNFLQLSVCMKLLFKEIRQQKARIKEDVRENTVYNFVHGAIAPNHNYFPVAILYMTWYHLDSVELTLGENCGVLKSVLFEQGTYFIPVLFSFAGTCIRVYYYQPFV